MSRGQTWSVEVWYDLAENYLMTRSPKAVASLMGRGWSTSMVMGALGRLMRAQQASSWVEACNLLLYGIHYEG